MKESIKLSDGRTFQTEKVEKEEVKPAHGRLDETQRDAELGVSAQGRWDACTMPALRSP